MPEGKSTNESLRILIVDQNVMRGSVLEDGLREAGYSNVVVVRDMQNLMRRIVDAEVVACATATPDFGWSLWQSRLDEYPVTSLPALEAVQAARRQSEAAAEELDLALRTALFVRSRCISLRHEVLAAAGECPSVDVDRLAADLDAGVARPAVVRQSAAARSGAATCSGYVVLPDGTGWCNPGVETSWLGPRMPRGTPTVEADDPDVYRELVATAAERATAGRRTAPGCTHAMEG
jgi:hypothetical protein